MEPASVIRLLVDGYYDENIYFQTPSHFIPNLTDPCLLDQLRRLEITLAVGEMDPFCENTCGLSGSLWDKGIPNRLELWKGEAHCAREWRQSGDRWCRSIYDPHRPEARLSLNLGKPPAN